ncbi:MAG: hypothetical protein HUU37_02890 [Bdellovibrionales bacterium]|nr:hypothetical protein [Bdellovibrionales bacterium]
MKSFVIPVFLLALTGISPPALAAPALPRVAGPWVQLRKSPLFGSEAWRLAPVWGVSLPRDVEFRIEKTYGRWLYGAPLPLRRMKASDRAPKGWVYSRMLLPDGDGDTASKRQWSQTQLVSHYSLQAWKKLGLSREENALLLPGFLDALVLSRKTLAAFRNQDEEDVSLSFPDFLSVAHASEDPSLGLSGADLKFLEEEFHAVQEEKKKEEKTRIARILRAPPVAPLSASVQAGVFGRYLLATKFSLPALNHEEVDGNIYMRAVARRVLEGCPKKILSHWEGRPWQIVRVLGWAGATERTKEWVQAELPGGYFAVSARAIEQAGNEAELAWLVARPLVRSVFLKWPKLSFAAWPASLSAPEAWSGILRAQSPKDAPGVDVGDELAVDETAFQCLAGAGYDPGAGLGYLKRLSVARDQAWAKWFFEHHVGFDYRLQRANALLLQGQARGKIGKASTTNPKRFRAATRLWNVVP